MTKPRHRTRERGGERHSDPVLHFVIKMTSKFELDSCLCVGGVVVNKLD